jgi:hypothetical protein
MTMSNIEWKKSKIDYDELNKLDTQRLARIDSINQNRTLESQSKGGKIGGKKNYENGTGLFSMSEEELLKARKKGAMMQSLEDKSKGGKIGGKLRKDKGKKIFMIDKNTNQILQEFITIVSAARYLNKRENKIRDVLSNRRKSAYGYLWRFK